jgi:hypothetical protein
VAKLDLSPLLLDELEDLEIVLLEVVVLVATNNTHHSAAD